MENAQSVFGQDNMVEPIGPISAIADEVDGGKEGMIESLGESILGSNLGDDNGVEYGEFKLPEGIDVDKNILAIATEQFRMMGLTQEQAQGIVDLSPQITETIRNAQQKEWDTTTSQWANQIRNDRDIGGANFKNSIARAERVLRNFDYDGKLKEFLVTTKAGNNPELIRFLVNIDTNLSESSLGRASAVGAKQELTDEEIFFPDDKPNKGLAL